MPHLKSALASAWRIARQSPPWIGLGLMLAMIALLLREWPGPSPITKLRPHVISGKFATVVIDPGHGGVDDGASAHGLQEKNLTLDIAQRLAHTLDQQGFAVLLTRRSDVYVSLSDRVALAEAVPQAVFVSLHCNYSDSPDSHGIEFYRCNLKTTGLNTFVRAVDSNEPISEAESRLAQCLNQAVITKMHLDSRGEKAANFFVVRNVDYPAVLIECGFLTNAEEAKHLQDPSYRENLAEALASGISAYHSLVAPDTIKSVSNPGGARSNSALSK